MTFVRPVPGQHPLFPSVELQDLEETTGSTANQLQKYLDILQHTNCKTVSVPTSFRDAEGFGLTCFVFSLRVSAWEMEEFASLEVE